MALESGNFIDDLVISNPPGTDGISEGDDHVRLIKKVVKATFPNADSAFPLRWTSGVWTSGATGGDKGADTLNAGDYYRDGVLVAGTQWFESSKQTITPAAELTIAHGLGAIPLAFWVLAVNESAGFGYSIGDRMFLSWTGTYDLTNPTGVSIAVDTSNLYITVPSLGIQMGTRSIGGTFNVTSPNWKLIGVAVL